MKNLIREALLMVLIALVIFVGLRFTVQTFVVYGPSMEPNFWEEQRLLVNKVVYNFHEPERGDVIIFHPPSSVQDSYIKRIIGLPGETVEIKDGRVYLHQQDGTMSELHEPYISEPSTRNYRGNTIPENEYFVMGDNRNNTNDSRNGWTVPEDSIIGKAWFSIWPPDLWGLAANYPLQEQIASASQ